MKKKTKIGEKKIGKIKGKEIFYGISLTVFHYCIHFSSL